MRADVWNLRSVRLEFLLTDNRAPIHSGAGDDKGVSDRGSALLRLLADQGLKMRDREYLPDELGFRRAQRALKISG